MALQTPNMTKNYVIELNRNKNKINHNKIRIRIKILRIKMDRTVDFSMYVHRKDSDSQDITPSNTMGHIARLTLKN
jgi:hypothetical protein